MDGFVMANVTGPPSPSPLASLSVELPDPGVRWPRTLMELLASRTRTGGRPLEDAYFSGSFVCADQLAVNYLASRGTGILAFRHAGFWHVVPIYCGALPATPLGHCFSFSPRRPETLALDGHRKLGLALTLEACFLPRRAGGRWAERTEQLPDRQTYSGLLAEWGRKDFADSWITALDHDPDASASGMPY